uniref:TF-B3 domain-containing protein n=1 Tax=Aegilops tauschii subsp. strangulata TaxID=200361 RepID=A0A453BTI0_AEGTS
MTETFATQGKRMVILCNYSVLFHIAWYKMIVTNLYNCFQYFNVHFSTGSLFPHMNADHGELPITTGDGTTTVTVRFIKGVDKRATITKGWSDFFRRTHMNEGQAYAFGFKCTSKGLRLIVYSI